MSGAECPEVTHIWHILGFRLMELALGFIVSDPGRLEKWHLTVELGKDS